MTDDAVKTYAALRKSIPRRISLRKVAQEMRINPDYLSQMFNVDTEGRPSAGMVARVRQAVADLVAAGE